MIRLTKGPKPPVLEEHQAEWTTEFVSGVDRRRYAHDDIRSALRIETNRKCAYCESRIEHVAPSHVEHIVPKSEHGELVCEWGNLTVACPTCNTKKGTYHNPACMILNPYRDDPEEHLRWVGPMLFAVTADRGKVTLTRLDLNRSELLYMRGEKIERASEIMRLKSSSPNAVAIALDEDLRRLQLDDAEYAAAVRAFVARETVVVASFETAISANSEDHD